MLVGPERKTGLSDTPAAGDPPSGALRRLAVAEKVREEEEARLRPTGRGSSLARPKTGTGGRRLGTAAEQPLS